MPGKIHPIDCLCSKPFGCNSKRIMSMMLLKCCLSLSFAASIVKGCLLQWVNLSLNSPWVILKLIHFLPFYSFLFFLCLIPIPTVFLPSNIYPAQMKPPQEKEREEDLFFFRILLLFLQLF